MTMCMYMYKYVYVYVYVQHMCTWLNVNAWELLHTMQTINEAHTTGNGDTHPSPHVGENARTKSI